MMFNFPWSNVPWAMWVFGLLNMVLFWGLIILAVVLVVRLLQRRDEPSPRGGEAPAPRWEDQALAILRERYARGEITREEFQRMQEDLQASPRP